MISDSSFIFTSRHTFIDDTAHIYLLHKRFLCTETETIRSWLAITLGEESCLYSHSTIRTVASTMEVNHFLWRYAIPRYDSDSPNSVLPIVSSSALNTAMVIYRPHIYVLICPHKVPPRPLASNPRQLREPQSLSPAYNQLQKSRLPRYPPFNSGYHSIILCSVVHYLARLLMTSQSDWANTGWRKRFRFNLSQDYPPIKSK